MQPPCLPLAPTCCRRTGLKAVAPLLVLSLNGTLAREVQHHGVVFEAWVRDTFFEGYRPSSYTQKWDIPASANRAHGGIPVNPKAIKYRGAIDLGDAIRQIKIDEPFILLAGFWQQEGELKRFVNLTAPRIEPATWKKLWGPVTLADVGHLDAVIKDPAKTPDEARAAAQALKNAPPFSQSIIVFNPKIDRHSQRRLQCSLRFEDFFRLLAPAADPKPQDPPSLWGKKLPQTIASKPRSFPK